MTTLPPHLRPAMRGTARTFWQAAARGELRLPRCRDCASFSWPPRSRCRDCGSHAIEWIAVSGRGVVHTYTVIRQASDPYFNARIPYTVAMVELEEGPRLMSNIANCDVDAVHIGMRVAVSFAEAGDGFALPVFAPIGQERR